MNPFVRLILASHSPTRFTLRYTVGLLPSDIVRRSQTPFHFATATDGAIYVEILDQEGYRLRGFSKDEALAIRGDNLRHTACLSDNPRTEVSMEITRTNVYYLVRHVGYGNPTYGRA